MELNIPPPRNIPQLTGLGCYTVSEYNYWRSTLHIYLVGYDIAMLRLQIVQYFQHTSVQLVQFLHQAQFMVKLISMHARHSNDDNSSDAKTV